MKKSTLTQEDVNNLMEKYHISSFSAVAAGDVLPTNPPPKHIVIYEHTLCDGLFFPLTSFISSTLRELSVTPGQLPPNAVRALVGFELLCFYHNMPRNPYHFIQLFKLTRGETHFYLNPRLKSPRIYCNMFNNPYKEWVDKYFFLEYDMGPCSETPLNQKDLEIYRLDIADLCSKKDIADPDVHAKLQVSRMIDLSKGWDNCLVRDYLMLAQESIFTDYTWPSESDRQRALNNWKTAFEQRSRSRKRYVVGPVGESVGQTNVQEASSREGEGEFSEFKMGLDIRKRCFSKAELEESTEDPAPTRAKIHPCSNISNHDVEGHNLGVDGFLGQMLSGATPITTEVAMTPPKTPRGRNCFSQNLAAVGEVPPANMTLLNVDMGKITSRFLSSVMEHEEKLAHIKEALDAKTAECQAWEEKFNMSQKEHELALLQQEEECDQKLKRCLNEHLQALSKQKEYEKLLEDQKSEIKLLKEQKEAVDTALSKVKVSFLNGLSDLEIARSLQRK